jgi:23S rRNA pseudouridine2457 synthase
MTAAVGNPTLRLIRIAVGPIALGELAAGRWRELMSEEIQKIGATIRQKGANSRS